MVLEVIRCALSTCLIGSRIAGSRRPSRTWTLCSWRFVSGRTNVEIGAEREVKPPRAGQAQRMSRGRLNRSCANVGDASLLGTMKFGALADIMRGFSWFVRKKRHPGLGWTLITVDPSRISSPIKLTCRISLTSYMCPGCVICQQESPGCVIFQQETQGSK